MANQVAEQDIKNLEAIRGNVSKFMAAAGKRFDKKDLKVLDIAPQDHEGAKPYFPKATVETLDIDQNSGATYIADLCEDNSGSIEKNRFDVVVCTEVLEHTLQPFDAVKELLRITKPGGYVLVSAPFNFRIHGPLPDCWRFTEHGLRALFKDFNIESITELGSSDRFLMPIHYTLIAQSKL